MSLAILCMCVCMRVCVCVCVACARALSFPSIHTLIKPYLALAANTPYNNGRDIVFSWILFFKLERCTNGKKALMCLKNISTRWSTIFADGRSLSISSILLVFLFEKPDGMGDRLVECVTNLLLAINLFSICASLSSNVCTYPLRGPLFLLSAYSQFNWSWKQFEHVGWWPSHLICFRRINRPTFLKETLHAPSSFDNRYKLVWFLPFSWADSDPLLFFFKKKVLYDNEKEGKKNLLFIFLKHKKRR